MSLKGRDLLTLKDFTAAEIRSILDRAVDMKRRVKQGEVIQPMRGKVMAMIFQKPSLRTRVSFESGMIRMGGNAIYLGPAEIGLGKRETVEDIAKVLCRQTDVIMARVFGHDIVEGLAKYSDVPVINGLSDYAHPCQALADFQTVIEHGKRLEGLRLTYIGDGNNVANSLIFGGVTLGAHVVTASPEGYMVSDEVRRWAVQTGAASGGSLTVTESVREASEGADVLYTDVWASMGQEEEQAIRQEKFKGYQINLQTLGWAKPDALVLHCLPAHYGDEITKDVVDSPNSAVFDEAENRLHAQKALVAMLAGSD